MKRTAGLAASVLLAACASHDPFNKTSTVFLMPNLADRARGQVLSNGDVFAKTFVHKKPAGELPQGAALRTTTGSLKISPHTPLYISALSETAEVLCTNELKSNEASSIPFGVCFRDTTVDGFFDKAAIYDFTNPLSVADGAMTGEHSMKPVAYTLDSDRMKNVEQVGMRYFASRSLEEIVRGQGLQTIIRKTVLKDKTWKHLDDMSPQYDLSKGESLSIQAYGGAYVLTRLDEGGVRVEEISSIQPRTTVLQKFSYIVSR